MGRTVHFPLNFLLLKVWSLRGEFNKIHEMLSYQSYYHTIGTLYWNVLVLIESEDGFKNRKVAKRTISTIKHFRYQITT